MPVAILIRSVHPAAKASVSSSGDEPGGAVEPARRQQMLGHPQRLEPHRLGADAELAQPRHRRVVEPGKGKAGQHQTETHGPTLREPLSLRADLWLRRTGILEIATVAALNAITEPTGDPTMTEFHYDHVHLREAPIPDATAAYYARKCSAPRR